MSIVDKSRTIIAPNLVGEFGRGRTRYECCASEEVTSFPCNSPVSLSFHRFNFLFILFGSSHASITVLGEKNFMCFTDMGKMEFILKLDYRPKCFQSFAIGYYWGELNRRGGGEM